MKLDTLPIGLYGENIYILHEDGHVLIIDPGRFADEIEKHISSNEIVDGILLTHGHHDHTGAVDDLVDRYHCPVMIHEEDYLLATTPGNAYNGGNEEPVVSSIQTIKEGDMTVGHYPLEIIHTPGHTSGSILIRYKNNLFTGDTLFAGTIGRTDLFSGNDIQMRESLKTIASLSHDLNIYPGHDMPSTMAKERKHNLYLSYFCQDHE